MSSSQRESCETPTRVGPIHFSPDAMQSAEESVPHGAGDVEELYSDLLKKLSVFGARLETDAASSYWILRVGTGYLALRRSNPPLDNEAFFYSAPTLSSAKKACTCELMELDAARRLMWITATKHSTGVGWQTYVGQTDTIHSRDVVALLEERLTKTSEVGLHGPHAQQSIPEECPRWRTDA